jgi:predicted dinucleotide-binding enzyme
MTTIVTGGSAGIGRAVALRLGGERMNVAVGYRSGRERAEDVYLAGKAGVEALNRVLARELGPDSSWVNGQVLAVNGGAA